MAVASAPSAPPPPPPGAVRLATVNVRSVCDRWMQRRPLLRARLAELDADVLAMQEVLTGSYGQDRALLQVGAHDLRTHGQERSRETAKADSGKVGRAKSESSDHGELDEVRARTAGRGSDSVTGYQTVLGCRAALHALRAEKRWYWVIIAGPYGLVQLIGSAVMRPLPAAIEILRERLAGSGRMCGRLLAELLLPLRQIVFLPWYGNSIAVRGAELVPDGSSLEPPASAGQQIAEDGEVDGPAVVRPVVGTHDLLSIGHMRSAHRVLCVVPDDRVARTEKRAHDRSPGVSNVAGRGVERPQQDASASAGTSHPRRMWVVNCHLHHDSDAPEVRVRQLQSVLDWLDAAEHEQPSDATVLMGDLNASPDEPALALLRDAGFWSAHAAANNGHEPKATYPSGIEAPLTDQDPPATIDYIFVRGAARCVGAHVVLTRPDDDDPTLFASDHFGIMAGA